MPSNHLILCRLLLFLPPIPPSIRVFSNESTLRMRWPKYWSFSLNISPSNEHPGLISFRMDCLDLLVVQGTLKSLLQHHSSKALILRRSAFFTVQLSHLYMTTGKTIALTRWTFVGKVMSLRDGNTRPPYLSPEKPICRSRSNRNLHGKNDWFKIGKGIHQGCILSPCLFNFYAEYIIQNARLDESQAGIKIARRNINNLRYADDTTLMAESEEELKSLLMKVKEESEKAGLKLNIQKMKIMASNPITSWQMDGEKKETVTDYFLGLQNHCGQ